MPRTILAALILLASAGAASATVHRHVAHAKAPASHAAIPQNTNIEHLNDVSLQRARNGQNTARPLAPPLAQ